MRYWAGISTPPPPFCAVHLLLPPIPPPSFCNGPDQRAKRLQYCTVWYVLRNVTRPDHLPLPPAPINIIPTSYSRLHCNCSNLDRRSTPLVFCTCFYNHAHRLHLEKLLYLGFSRSSNGFFNHFLDPDTYFASETAARRLQNWNGRYGTIS
jgi:hypothetical protein